jgi:ATP-dependent Lon protease
MMIVFPYVKTSVKRVDLEEINGFLLARASPSLGTFCKIESSSGDDVIVEGVHRVKIIDSVIEIVPDRNPPYTEVMTALVNRLNEFMRVMKEETKSSKVVVGTEVPPGVFSYRVADVLYRSFGIISDHDALVMLGTSDTSERISLLGEWIERCTAGLGAIREIRESMKAEKSAELKQMIIRSQILALEKQLTMSGDKSTRNDDHSKFSKKIKTLTIPHDAKSIIQRELDRISTLPSHHPEYHGIVNFLEQALALPWKTPSTLSAPSLSSAESILNKDHFGMEKVKRKIVEFLAVHSLNVTGFTGPTLCLIGPPGVGKTSIVASIAEALNREFIRISLGGVRDAAELRGHRKTYIGAMPGRIMQSLIRAKSRNPVILLDEIDKVSDGGAGHVLLELLDPAQNRSFTDTFFGFEFDISQCMFVCTANSIIDLPRPLRDRLDIIPMQGYLVEEKLEIASKYLIPKSVRLAGLVQSRIRIPPNSVRVIIESYTAESGVRTLEKRIGDICRYVAEKIVREKEQGVVDNSSVYEFITLESISAVLGPPLLEGSPLPSSLPIGVSLGLAVTPVGGDVLFVESVSLGPGTGKITVTGQLGDVMRESVSACASLLVARALRNPNDPTSIYSMLDAKYIKSTDIHVHFPNGAVQKDGPSAGVATSIALASLFTNVPARPDVASTGEITLRGDVLRIGGVRDKVLAAHRAGLKTVILPWGNRRDVGDIPNHVRGEIELKFVRTIDQAMNVAFNHTVAMKHVPQFPISAL